MVVCWPTLFLILAVREVMPFPLGGVSELDGQKQGITFLIFPRTGNVCFIGLIGQAKKDENGSFNNKPLWNYMNFIERMEVFQS